MVNFESGHMIGIDVGLSSIKVCQVEEARKGRYKLNLFKIVHLSEAAIIEDEIQKPEEVIDAIREIIEESKTKKKIACLGMKGPNTVTKRLQVPDGSADEIEDNVLWESEQYLPFGADDAEVGFSILGKIEEDDVVDVIVGAVKTDVVEKYMNYLKEAGLHVKVVDLSVFSIVNVYEALLADRLEDIMDEGGSIIIDFGAQYTTVIVYKNRGPVLTKEINLGGVLITEEIQRTLGVSYEEAEDLKISGDENGNLPEEILTLMDEHVRKIMEELKKILNFFISVGSSEQVGSCFITGGSSKIPGLKESLAELVDLEVEELDPLEILDIKSNLTEEEMYNLQTSGVGAVGLAMRKV